MSNNLETRMRLQNTMKQMVFSIMQQNQVSATDMEDALNKVMLDLKDQAYQELIAELVASQQEAATTKPIEKVSEDLENE